MASNIQKINAKSAAAYVLLPGIIPRLKDLLGTGFGYLAFLIASVFQSVRILPTGHPMANPSYIGKFSIRAVLSTSANHIQFTKRHIDQIVVFGAVLLALVLLALQIVLFILALLTGTAFAGNDGGTTTPFTNIFVTDKPENDIAFMMLDYVFGIPDLFGSSALEGGITPFHHGLHDLFEFYNLAILLVGVLIFLYYVIVVVIETAQTGVPFGRRFSKIYAPLRLVAAIGLLVPLNYGFNTAQYITFFFAKVGSSFATNGWLVYNQNLDNPLGVQNETLIAGVKAPDISGLFYFVSVYHSCRTAYDLYVPKQTFSYANSAGDVSGTIKIKPYVIVNNKATEFTSYSYAQAKADQASGYFGSSLDIYLAEEDSRHNTTANLNPYCGKMVVSLSSRNSPYFQNNAGGTGGGASAPAGSIKGVLRIEEEYYKMLQDLLSTDNAVAYLGERAAHHEIKNDSCYNQDKLGDSCVSWPPSPSVIKTTTENYRTNLINAVEAAVSDLRGDIDLRLNEELGKLGWGGAGIWYNRVAELNGSVSAAAMAAPRPAEYPQVMDSVRKQRQQSDTGTTPCETFSPNLADQVTVDFNNDLYKPAIARVGYNMHKWSCERSGEEGSIPQGLTGNVFLDIVGVVFGIHGIFDLREQTRMDPDTYQPKVHPLAALSSIGKALVENAIRSMATSLFFSFGGGMDSILGQHIGAGLQSISKMFVNISTIGLTAGFILYYILPFLPFIYFFFAVGSWVKSIFEAMVGAPLWALAHIRIDGDGFSGRAASGGYFLLLEIMLRPIVILFGLIGGMAIFGTMISVLNEIFGLVVGNIAGGRPTDANDFDLPTLGAIDTFFFTIMYTILVYMIGTACFKMIDTIPKQIMRWIGSQVSTFNDNTGDPTANLTQYTALASSQFAGPILDGLNQGVAGIGKAGNAVVNMAQKGTQ
jgi:conjugal transfer/type IV secretion protein DotA/TraY